MRPRARSPVDRGSPSGGLAVDFATVDKWRDRCRRVPFFARHEFFPAICQVDGWTVQSDSLPNEDRLIVFQFCNFDIRQRSRPRGSWLIFDN